MEWMNDVIAEQMKLGPETVEKFLTAFSVMAPFMTAELLNVLFCKSFADCVWPVFDPMMAAEDETTIAIQVNGKLRGNIVCTRGANQGEVEPKARDVIIKWLDGKNIVRTIFVKDRLINFVVK